MRRPLAGKRSIMSAITSPVTGQNVHRPPNQLWTAEYHRSVVGRKTNPRIGQSALSKTPLNHVVKNQSSAATSRGAARARSESRHGIVTASAWVASREPRQYTRTLARFFGIQGSGVGQLIMLFRLRIEDCGLRTNGHRGSATK